MPVAIFYLLIILSIIGIGVILYRKVPVLNSLSEEEISILKRKKGIKDKVKEIDLKGHWLNFIVGLEKFLRRVKIIFLKIENILGKWIERLRLRSQVMTQKSREWIRQREMKRRQIKNESSPKEPKENISVRDEEEKKPSLEVKKEELEIDEDAIPLDELRKPIKEEQKWIDLIVENPKNITAYKFLGLLYWKQHNHKDAKASLEMAVKLGSKDRKVREVLEELKKMGE